MIDDATWLAIKPLVEQAVGHVDEASALSVRQMLIGWGDTPQPWITLDVNAVCEAIEPALALALLLKGHEVVAHYGVSER